MQPCHPLMLSFTSTTGGQSTSADEMLGNQGVTESNMMQYLGKHLAFKAIALDGRPAS